MIDLKYLCNEVIDDTVEFLNSNRKHSFVRYSYLI